MQRAGPGREGKPGEEPEQKEGPSTTDPFFGARDAVQETTQSQSRLFYTREGKATAAVPFREAARNRWNFAGGKKTMSSDPFPVDMRLVSSVYVLYSLETLLLGGLGGLQG